jgi:hypothetical protein
MVARHLAGGSLHRRVLSFAEYPTD